MQTTEKRYVRPLNGMGSLAKPFWNNKLISSLEFERVIRAWPEQVFERFTSEKALQSWLSPRVAANVRCGGDFVFSWGCNGKVTGEFVEITDDELIRFTWEDVASRQTLVTIELRGIGLKTRLRLTHELYGESTKAEWNDGHLNEWIFFLDNLISQVELDVDLRPLKAQEDGWGWLLGKFYSV